MARNGAGTYVLPAGQPVVTGTTISSATHNTLATDLANALTTSIATDGQSVVTANIPFAGYKLTGIGNATVNGDAIRYEDKVALQATDAANLSAVQAGIQAQTYTAFTTGGTTTAYTLTPTPAIGSLAAGQRFRVKFNAANTSTTPTLAVNGLAATALKVYDSTGAKQSPAVGALALNMLTDVEYDGTDYVVMDKLPAPFLSVFTSTAQTITFGGALQLPHGLGGMPSLVQIRLKCVTAEGGYSIGDEMIYNPQGDYDGIAVRGLSLVLTSVNIDIRFSSNNLQAVRKDNGAGFAITAANWNLIARAWI